MKYILLALCLIFVGYTAATEFGTAPSCVLNKNCMSHDWAQVDRADPDATIKLVFALKQQNLDVLEKVLYSVSDPKSSHYGKHLSLEEIGKLTTNPFSEPAVRLWLLASGIHNRDIVPTQNKDFLHVTTSVQIAEKLFSTHFFNFHSKLVESTIIRALSYSIPSFIAPHVDFVSGTVQFPPRRMKFGVVEKRVHKKDGVLSNGNVDPALIKQYYNISSNTVKSDKSTQSLFESLGQSYSPSDLSTFQSQFNLPNQAISTLIGPNKPAICSLNPNNCVEANLDVQYIMAVAQGAPTTYWSIPSSNQDIYLEWVLAVANATNPPYVHSMSYGSVESEEDPSSQQRFCTEAQKLGARGITIMIASGDDGVANFVARSDPSQCGFNPSYPANCPYVTSVGATQGPEDSDPEIMCSSSTNGLITSGGGFSAVFSQPSYQSSQVNSYLQNGPKLPPTSMFASTGRGYPDVAALGHNFEECIGGQFYQVSGTSAASPTFAGFISLINGMRLEAGKPALGFLNTMLYQLSSDVFHDITSGTNNCCAGSPGSQTCCKYGFTAGEGWDPTTGLGSIDFGKFAAALLDA